MFDNQYYIYIITNKKNGTLYSGVTNDLPRRIGEHKQKILDGFSKKYSLDRLVYYEIYDDINIAIAREKTLKKVNRKYKLDLINKFNPEWDDLYNTLFWSI